MMLTTLSGQRNLPRWFEAFFSTAQRMPTGRLDIRLPDGRLFSASGPADGPHGRMDICNPGFFSRLVSEGEIALAEMYMERWWDTPDLQATLDVIMLNTENMEYGFKGMGLIRAYERLRHWMRSNTRRGSRRNIAHHYDLGNEFYRLWLDETMTYSSAMFSSPDEPLRDAQNKKYDTICERMSLAPGDKVLEVGCGWGGFAEYAIRERGVHLTGLTLSREQYDFARQRLFQAGLAERAQILLRDYRDERGSYDGIASIEMFEAVGREYWGDYFRTLHACLKPGGLACIQSITIRDDLFARYVRSTDFIQQYIFPGGLLPSAEAFRAEARKAGFEVVGELAFGADYAETLRRWRAEFLARDGQVRRLGFDTRFMRIWEFYLAYCEAAFSAGNTDVVQFTLRRA